MFSCYHVYFTSNLFTCLLVYLSTILPCLLHKQLVYLSTCQPYYHVYFTSNSFTCLLVNHITMSTSQATCSLVYLSTCQPYYHVYFTSNSFTCLPEKKFENSIYILTLTKGGQIKLSGLSKISADLVIFSFSD